MLKLSEMRRIMMGSLGWLAVMKPGQDSRRARLSLRIGTHDGGVGATGLFEKLETDRGFAASVGDR